MSIGIIDSGIGGKGIEKEIKKLLPKVKVLYLGDRKNFPYGTKPARVLNKIIEDNANALINKGARVIVLACNSGSVTSLKYLRRKIKVPIVGVVPAIKPAAAATQTKKIAIFATPITTKSVVQENLIKEFCRGIKVYKIPFANLAGKIEYGELAEAKADISRKWQQYKDKNIDAIVLGCTHYTLIKKAIQKIVGKNILVIDSNTAVAKQTKRLYDKIREGDVEES
jgi:glutamate racemase